MLFEVCICWDVQRGGDAPHQIYHPPADPPGPQKKLLIFVKLMYLMPVPFVFLFFSSTNKFVLGNRYSQGLNTTLYCGMVTQTFTECAMCVCTKPLVHIVLFNPHYNPVYPHCTDGETESLKG